MDYFGTTNEDTAAAAAVINEFLDSKGITYKEKNHAAFPFSREYIFPDDIVHLVISANSLITPKNISVKLYMDVPSPLSDKLESIGEDPFYYYNTRFGKLAYQTSVKTETELKKLTQIIEPFFRIQGYPAELEELRYQLEEVLDVMEITVSHKAVQLLYEDADRLHGILYNRCKELDFDFGYFQDITTHFYKTKNMIQGKEVEE